MLKPQLKTVLEKQSQIIDSTCGYLLKQKDGFPQPFDYSVIIVGYYKIIEVEIEYKIFRPFSRELARKEKVTAKSFKDEYQRNVDSLSNYLKYNQPMSLGEMLNILKHLGNINSDIKGNLYSKLKAFLRYHYFRPYYFFGKVNLAERIQLSLIKYMNPAVHRKIFSLSDFDDFCKIFGGSGTTLGLLNLTVTALMQKKKRYNHNLGSDRAKSLIFR